MASPTLAIAILAVLCLAFQISASELNKSYHVPDHYILTDKTSLSKTSLLYLVCPTNDSEVYNCRLTLDAHNPAHDRHCNVTFKSNNNQLPNMVQVTLLQANKALVVSYESRANDDQQEPVSIVKLLTVHLDGCRTTEAKFHVDKIKLVYSIKLERFYPLVAYNGTVDFVFRNEKLCGDKQCKVTLDAEGKAMASPVAWYPSEDEEVALAAIEPQSQSKGLLLFKYGDDTSVSLVNSKGLKELKKHIFEGTPTSQTWLAHSTAHGAIGICKRLMNSTAICTHFDPEGKQTSEATLSLEPGARVLSLYNLPSGGYLLLTGGCQLTCPEKSSYNVTKVNADGERVGSLELAGFKCYKPISLYPYSNIFENESKKYCVSLVCSSERYVNLQLYAKCFSDEDLSS